MEKAKGKDRRVKIHGKTIMGENRTYEFDKIPAIVGVRLSYEYSSIIISNLKQIQETFSFLFDKSDSLHKVVDGFAKKDEEVSIIQKVVELAGLVPIVTPLIELIPKIVSWQRLSELSMDLLAGGSVDGEVIDSDGMCDLFGSDPAELYAALFWALSINYPKYFSFLLQALEEGADDTTQGSAAI